MNRPDPTAPVPQTPGLRFTHDPITNVAYVYLADPRVAGGSHRCEYALDKRAVFDLDAQDRLLGIELLDARLLRPETLELASSPQRTAEDHLDPLDREVVAACGGDRGAIERLCRQYQEMLRLEAARALGRPAETGSPTSASGSERSRRCHSCRLRSQSSCSSTCTRPTLRTITTTWGPDSPASRALRGSIPTS